jgi:predicted outer membrane protein
MTFKPAIWYPIAVVLSAANLLAAGFAIGQAEPVHATVHVALALAFGLWGRRLRQGPAASEVLDRLEALEALEVEVGNLRQELGETQERLDFAERMLAQGAEARRVGPEG